ncbi:MAG: PQQ-binding-like beta-propeller repeat protein [Euryarchaeota archaeon]|nr:PQQ-binding-like beta-propeller repeat protein [Euryarchaeota archaeon]
MPRVLVANTLDGSVTFFDATTRKRLETVKVGGSPQGIGIAKNGKFGYVTSATEGSVSVIDLVRMKETARLAPEGLEEPAGVCVLSDGRTLFVVGAEGTAYVVDAGSGAVRRTVDLGGRVAQAAAMSPVGDRIWFAAPERDLVLRVDARLGKVLDEVALEGHPGAVALARDNRRLVVGLRKPARCVLFDPESARTESGAKVGEGPVDVATHPYRDQAFVLARAAGSLFVVDLATGAASPPVPVGLEPVSMALARAGKTAYVANSGSDSISVVEVPEERVRHTWDAGHNPGAIRFIG